MQRHFADDWLLRQDLSLVVRACEQTRKFAEQTRDRGDKKPEMIQHDRDLKFTKDFTATVKDCGLKTNPLPIESPNLNGRYERAIETIKLEACRNSSSSVSGIWIISWGSLIF
jgi:hypothetical protein